MGKNNSAVHVKDEIRITSCTGMGIRNDSKGLGHYGAKRGRRKHYGEDHEGVPGQDVFCPIHSGKLVRKSCPSNDPNFSGVLIEGKHISVKMFYVDPWMHLMGKKVKRGDIIGILQDVRDKYGKKMKPHVHLRVNSIDPNLLT